MNKQTYETPTIMEYVFELEGCIAQSIPETGQDEGDWN